MNELNTESRINLCKFAIETLKTEEDSNPLKADAIAHYEAQLEELKLKLADEKNPPAIIVGLKSATLSGKTKE